LAREAYLADTSAFTRLPQPKVASAFAQLAAEGKVALCAPVAFELGYAARNPGDYRDLMDRLLGFAWVPVTDGAHRRALDIQAALALKSQHRAMSLVDALVAAIAEAHDLVVLHYDADFELISGITGQPHEWIVSRGSVS
jgi:predicted nucleic acid-binding protein